jgi:hypothetical protein
MTQSLAVSARSVLIAGMSAAVVASAVATPVTVPDVTTAKITAIATQLTSVTAPIEVAIKNTYNAVEPWAAWGAALGQWALGFVPGLWWFAPGVSLAYYTAEPLVQAGVYSFADVVGLDFAQIGPDISTGITQSFNNAVSYGLAWLNSLVPLPPLPPFPPRPGAAVNAAPIAPAAATTTVVPGPSAKSFTTPIEVAIKNTYNAVEPWARYGMQWVDYVAGLIPIVNWFSPAIPLAYYSIEPLFRAGTYATADLIGLNFAAIGPDIWNGVTTSANNFIAGVLNWANIPLPPPLPGAAVAAPPAASLRAAAAVAAPAEIAAPEAPAATGTAPKAESAPVSGKDAPAVPEHAAPAVPAAGGTMSETVTAATESTPATEAPAVPEAPAVTEAPAIEPKAAPEPARAGHRGPGASATAGESQDSDTPAKAGRHARGSD